MTHWRILTGLLMRSRAISLPPISISISIARFPVHANDECFLAHKHFVKHAPKSKYTASYSGKQKNVKVSMFLAWGVLPLRLQALQLTALAALSYFVEAASWSDSNVFPIGTIQSARQLVERFDSAAIFFFEMDVFGHRIFLVVDWFASAAVLLIGRLRA